SWGRMLQESQQFLSTHPELALWPGLFIALAVLGFILLCDCLRDRFDPKMDARRVCESARGPEPVHSTPRFSGPCARRCESEPGGGGEGRADRGVRIRQITDCPIGDGTAARGAARAGPGGTAGPQRESPRRE